MKKAYHCNNIIDDWTDGIYGQKVYDADTGKVVYEVYNLTDCPEDAVIYRDLISASEYVDILRQGIELAKQGFDDIELIDGGDVAR